MNQYRIGSTYKICQGSGIFSNQLVIIIPWFDWHKATDGTYSPPDNRQVAIKYENGDIGFMYKKRLIPINLEDIFDERI